jgi:hypothetical protein
MTSFGSRNFEKTSIAARHTSLQIALHNWRSHSVWQTCCALVQSIGRSFSMEGASNGFAFDLDALHDGRLLGIILVVLLCGVTRFQNGQACVTAAKLWNRL